MRHRKTLTYATVAVMLATVIGTGSVAAASRPSAHRAAVTSSATTSTSPAATTSALRLPVKGVVKNLAGDVVGTVHGRILRFVTRNHHVYAVTRLVGSAGNTDLSLTRKILVKRMSNGTSTAGTTAVPTAVSCSILHLVLGPLDLNLLGLRIQLNRVHLDITAVPGAGNLLGNLLCSIVHLFDQGRPFLSNVSTLLNQVLSILGKLGA